MDDVAFLKEWINKKNKEGMTNLDARLILNEFEQFLKYIRHKSIYGNLV